MRSGFHVAGYLASKSGSVLAHEMAHSLVTRSRGIRVRDITLFLVGGALQYNASRFPTSVRSQSSHLQGVSRT